MPVNTSITAGALQPPQQQNPIQQLAALMQIMQAQKQGELTDLKLQQERESAPFDLVKKRAEAEKLGRSMALQRRVDAGEFTIPGRQGIPAPWEQNPEHAGPGFATIKPSLDYESLVNAKVGAGELNPETIVQHRANRQLAQQRYEQMVLEAGRQHDYRMSQLTNATDRQAETQRHNRVMEDLGKSALAQGLATFAYNIGGPMPFVPPSVAPPNYVPGVAPQQQAPTGPSVSDYRNSAEYASLSPQARANFDAVAARQAQGMTTTTAQNPYQTTPETPSFSGTVNAGVEGRPPQATAQPLVPGIGGAPAATMPEFTGSPKAIAEAQNRWKMEQARQSISGSGNFTPETLRFVAKQYLTGDRQAVQGFARSTTARVALQNAIVDEAIAQGLSPEQTASKIAEFAGTVAGSRTVGQRAANISLAATEAKEMIPIVKEQSDKFARSEFVPWNIALRAYETNTGSPEIAAFGASINALVNVYARAINPTGVPTVSDKEHARAVLNTVQSPAQVNAVLSIIQRELSIAQSAPETVRKGIRGSITGNNPPSNGATQNGGRGQVESDEALIERYRRR